MECAIKNNLLHLLRLWPETTSGVPVRRPTRRKPRSIKPHRLQEPKRATPNRRRANDLRKPTNPNLPQDFRRPPATTLTATEPYANSACPHQPTTRTESSTAPAQNGRCRSPHCPRVSA